MTTNSSQFNQVFINDASATQQEISNYITAADPQVSNADTNVSTFNAGGNPVTSTHIRGAISADFQAKGLFDPTYAKIMRQIIAIRAGTTYTQKAGSNNIPGQADELYAATVCPIGYTLTYNFGSTASMDFDLKLADGAGIPGFAAI